MSGARAILNTGVEPTLSLIDWNNFGSPFGGKFLSRKITYDSLAKLTSSYVWNSLFVGFVDFWKASYLDIFLLVALISFMIHPLISSLSIREHCIPALSNIGIKELTKVDLPNPGIPKGMITNIDFGADFASVINSEYFPTSIVSFIYFSSSRIFYSSESTGIMKFGQREV